MQKKEKSRPSGRVKTLNFVSWKQSSLIRRIDSAENPMSRSEFIENIDKKEAVTPSIMIPQHFSVNSDTSSVLNLQNFKLRWTLKKMLRRLQALVVPERNHTG